MPARETKRIVFFTRRMQPIHLQDQSSPAIGTKILSGKRLLDLIQKPFSRFEDEERLGVIKYDSPSGRRIHTLTLRTSD
jgi:hypothetical protein